MTLEFLECKYKEVIRNGFDVIEVAIDIRSIFKKQIFGYKLDLDFVDNSKEFLQLLSKRDDIQILLVGVDDYSSEIYTNFLKLFRIDSEISYSSSYDILISDKCELINFEELIITFSKLEVLPEIISDIDTEEDIYTTLQSIGDDIYTKSCIENNYLNFKFNLLEIKHLVSDISQYDNEFLKLNEKIMKVSF